MIATVATVFHSDLWGLVVIFSFSRTHLWAKLNCCKGINSVFFGDLVPNAEKVMRYRIKKLIVHAEREASEC